jgi:hypothetical protein
VITEFHTAKSTLETQLKEVEALYTDEIRNSNAPNPRQTRMKSAMKKFKENYVFGYLFV